MCGSPCSPLLCPLLPCSFWKHPTPQCSAIRAFAPAVPSAFPCELRFCLPSLLLQGDSQAAGPRPLSSLGSPPPTPFPSLWEPGFPPCSSISVSLHLACEVYVQCRPAGELETWPQIVSVWPAPPHILAILFSAQNSPLLCPSRLN